MDKKTFLVNLRFGAELKFVDIQYEDERFYLQFTDDDEWSAFTTADKEIYDIHLLREDKWEVSIYHVIITHELEEKSGITLEYLNTDCSSEGQQNVLLTIGDEK